MGGHPWGGGVAHLVRGEPVTTFWRPRGRRWWPLTFEDRLPPDRDDGVMWVSGRALYCSLVQFVGWQMAWVGRTTSRTSIWMEVEL